MRFSPLTWHKLDHEFLIRTSQVFTTLSTPTSTFFNNRSHFPQLDVTLNLCCHLSPPPFSVGVLTVGASTVGVLTVGASTVGVLPVEAMLLSPLYKHAPQAFFHDHSNPIYTSSALFQVFAYKPNKANVRFNDKNT